MPINSPPHFPRQPFTFVLALSAALTLALPSGAQPANLPAQPISPALWNSMPPGNQAVVKFAVEHIGQSIDSGECPALAERALDSANCHYEYGFNWGRPLNPGEQPLPGDIIQFYKCKFKEVTPTRWWVMEAGYPDHTAIIRSLEDDRTVVLHQNFAGNRSVHQSTFKLGSLYKGKYQIYRPLPASPEQTRQN